MQGDSGGPLTVLDNDGRHTLAGIVSKKLSGTDCIFDVSLFHREKNGKYFRLAK